MSRILLIDMGMLRADFHVAPEGAGTRFASRIETLWDHLSRQMEVAAAICLDSSEWSWRRDLQPTYKANRPPLEEQQRDELNFETDEAVRLLQRSGASVHQADGYEADDVIATLVQEQLDSGGQSIIHSPDKDCNQLVVRKSVSRLSKVRREAGRLQPKWYTWDQVARRWGVTPAQWVDYQILVGDTADNIGGCPWVGPKKAVRWLQRYGTLEEIVRHRAALGLKGRNLSSFDRFVPQIDTIRKVVTLVRDVPGVTLRQQLPF